MKCCSLQHWTLLSPPDTSTNGHPFRYGSVLFIPSGAISLLLPRGILDFCCCCCCCCCQVTSVVSDSVRPHRRQPTRLPLPWDSPGKNTGVGCHFLLQCMKVKSEREVAQSCPTLSDPMDCSLPGSSVHGIFQARVLEWGAIAFSTYWTPTDLESLSFSVISFCLFVLLMGLSGK